MPLERLKRLFDVLSTVLKYPLLIALFSLNVFVLIPLGFMSISKYGFLGFALLMIFESPAIFLIVREAWRQAKLAPAVDRWETSPERWTEALDEYVKTVNKKQED